MCLGERARARACVCGVENAPESVKTKWVLCDTMGGRGEREDMAR